MRDNDHDAHPSVDASKSRGHVVRLSNGPAMASQGYDVPMLQCEPMFLCRSGLRCDAVRRTRTSVVPIDCLPLLLLLSLLLSLLLVLRSVRLALPPLRHVAITDGVHG